MIGKTVSHYRILEQLGAGGMGVVYKAEDTKLGRTVALKFLPPELTRDNNAKTRFIHEARAASALQHHNICTIHEIDETPEGQLFIAMDCYQGETLKERIARGPLAVEEAVDIASQVAAGLSKAHEAGMVHRDVKPANIMVTTDGVVKILDFGLAKLAGMTKITKTGTTVGTVSYMSPEQARGEEVDARSDIFSLGAVFYEMLTGAVPFPGDHEAAVLYGIIHGEPKPLAEVDKSLPQGLQGIIDRALKKDPKERYQSAIAMKADIEGMLGSGAGRRAGSRAATGLGRAAPRTRIWVFLAVLAIVIAVGVVALVQMRSPKETVTAPKDLSMAIIDFRDLVHPDDPAPAAGITNLVQVGLTESSPIRPISPERLYDIRRRLFGSGRGSIQDDQVFEVARKAGSAVFLYAEITGTTTEQYVTWRLVETKNGRSLGTRTVQGKTLAEFANGIVQGVLPLLATEAGSKPAESPASVDGLTTSSEEAYEHYVRGLLALERIGANTEAAADFEKAVELDSTFALAYYQLAKVNFDMSGGHSAGLSREYAEKAWAHRGNLNTRDRMRLEAFREHAGAGNVPDAMTTYREMLARWPDDLETLKSLSQYLFFYWYFRDAESVAKQGLALYPDDQDLEICWEASLSYSGRAEEALTASLAYVKTHPGNAVALNNLAGRYLQTGLPDSAEAINRRILLADPNNLECLGDIASCAYARGDVNQSIEVLEQLVGRADVSNSWRMGKFIAGFGPGLVMLPAEIGRFDKAFELLEQAESCARAAGGKAAFGVLLLAASGQTKEAVRLAREELTHFDPGKSFNPWWHYCLIEALVAADSVREARTVLSDALFHMNKEGERMFLPSKDMVLRAASIVSLAEGDSEGALNYIREIEKLSRRASGGDAIRTRETRARAYWKSGHLDEAVGAYKDLLRIFGGHAMSHYELGQVYEQMGRTAEAKQEYSRFLEMCAQADKGWVPVEDAKTRFSRL